MAGTVIWGVFLIAVGLGLVIFNKQWAAFGARSMPWNPYARSPFVGRLLTFVVAPMMILAGIGTARVSA